MVSIVIPTRGRPGYVDVALASVAPQALGAGGEVLVVTDGEDAATASVAGRHRARFIALPAGAGANAKRNAGAAAASGDLIVFIDDDIEAPAGWLSALLAAVADAPEYDVFGGPIRAALEGGGPRACGREGAPITTLDLGPVDGEAEFVWGANMAVRRPALARVGAFDESIDGAGEEEDWQRRHLAAGGRTRYVAGAGVDHRRVGADAGLRSLSRAAYFRGRSARRFDVLTGRAPGLGGELRVLAGCGWHVVRRRCLNGVVMGAHAWGRVRESVAGAGGGAVGAAVGGDDFVSGTSGYVTGIRATTRAVVSDAALDAVALARGERWRLRRAAARWPRRRVLALGVERTDRQNVLASAREELLRSRHHVEFFAIPVEDRGKFENLNALLAEHPAAGHDWLIAIDDDVALPPGFLDTFIFLAERFGLALAQPAHRRNSHAAFPVTRRQAATVARETAFVEIGPVVAFQAVTFDTLLPFPPLRIGWGLDAHWSAIAREHGWRIGVIDATPIGHGLRLIAGAYDREDALAEARAFLAERPYTPAAEASRTLAAHRSWR
ncbi:MAG TPA: glycosyltransferase [Solirubrobacteraceae bacterium]|nr:glycosyltransferase [Solirubrobacteraceae bacterium]